jgi:DNA polymerase-3 subunit alpha
MNATSQKSSEINFVHLNVHSENSLGDGMCKISDLIAKSKEDGMYAMALTDNGNLFGIKDFIDKVAKTNLSRAEGEPEFKPIIGMDAYCARRTMYDKDNNLWEKDPITDENRHTDAGGYRLTLLAKNLNGYHSLCKLTSLSYIDGMFGGIPRIDRFVLAKHKDGLIVLSGGIEGELSQLILKGDFTGAEKTAEWYKEQFGEDYYIELMRHKTDKPNANLTTYKCQMKVEPELIRIARKLNVKLIATNNVLYVYEQQGETHRHFKCLADYDSFDISNYSANTKQEWFKSPAEMYDAFSDLPEAIENSIEIVNKVEIFPIRQVQKLPSVTIPATLSDTIKTEDEYLEHLAWEGANKRYDDNLTEEQRGRIIHELDVIKKNGFASYYLLLWDIVRAAREELGLAVGPGRGSAAGSIVAYCLHITDIDPLRYGLLFECVFTTPHIKLPDIDIDFEADGREKVIAWMKKKYGEKCVANIITFGHLSTEKSLAEMQRMEKVPTEMADALNRRIPHTFDELKDEKGRPLKINLFNCYKYIPEFRSIMESDDVKMKQVLTMAAELDEIKRYIGIHACGIVVAPQDISNTVPLCMVKNINGERVLATQYDGQAVEDVGLVKLDFLGLNILTAIKKCVARIKNSSGIKVDIDNIPLDDELTFKLFADGNTVGVFQFDSTGMKIHLGKLQTHSFSDLVALNSLYRPGTMHNIVKLIDRKHGNEEISYLLPEMEPYLKETYGITVYQEQIMQLSQKLAGFTPTESNLLRRAFGTKQKDALDFMKHQFYEGGQKNGYSKEVLAQIWNGWVTEGRLPFNKSHAVCYTWLAYQTAYLKAHYPAEYMSTIISLAFNDRNRVKELLTDCRDNGLSVNIQTQNFRIGYKDGAEHTVGYKEISIN